MKWKRSKLAMGRQFTPLNLLLCLVALLALPWLSGVYVGSQKEAIAAAIVREKLKDSPGAAFFVSIDDEDPSNDFIRNFTGGSALIRKQSQGVATINPITKDPWSLRYTDKISGKIGSPMFIEKTVWWIPFYISVGVNYPGVGQRFTLRKSLKGWTVMKKEMSWIA